MWLCCWNGFISNHSCNLELGKTGNPQIKISKKQRGKCIKVQMAKTVRGGREHSTLAKSEFKVLVGLLQNLWGQGGTGRGDQRQRQPYSWKWWGDRWVWVGGGHPGDYQATRRALHHPTTFQALLGSRSSQPREWAAPTAPGLRTTTGFLQTRAPNGPEHQKKVLCVSGRGRTQSSLGRCNFLKRFAGKLEFWEVKNHKESWKTRHTPKHLGLASGANSQEIY